MNNLKNKNKWLLTWLKIHNQRKNFEEQLLPGELFPEKLQKLQKLEIAVDNHVDLIENNLNSKSKTPPSVNLTLIDFATMPIVIHRAPNYASE